MPRLKCGAQAEMPVAECLSPKCEDLSPVPLSSPGRRSDAEPGELWTGELGFKGLSATARGRFAIAPIAVDLPLPRYFVPYQVTGPVSFQLIHVWAQNEGVDRYVRGVVRAVDLWSERIAAQPTVIAGDFNANAFWDAEHPADGNFTALARKLESLGLVSAYHEFFGEKFGQETRPTFFLYRYEQKAFTSITASCRASGLRESIPWR